MGKLSLLIALIVSIVMSGCNFEKSIETIKKECQNEGKTFSLNEKLNFRTGEYETIVNCN